MTAAVRHLAPPAGALKPGAPAAPRLMAPARVMLVAVACDVALGAVQAPVPGAALALLALLALYAAAGRPLAGLRRRHPLALGIAASPLMALAMELSPAVTVSLSLRSATTAASAPAASALGADPSLTAGVVILTGLVGGLAGPSFLRLIGVRDPRAMGLALGVGAHGLGVARAFALSPVCGAFASLGMILNALFTVLAVAILVG